MLILSRDNADRRGVGLRNRQEDRYFWARLRHARVQQAAVFRIVKKEKLFHKKMGEGETILSRLIITFTRRALGSRCRGEDVCQMQFRCRIRGGFDVDPEEGRSAHSLELLMGGFEKAQSLGVLLVLCFQCVICRAVLDGVSFELGGVLQSQGVEESQVFRRPMPPSEIVTSREACTWLSDSILAS
jgi:hypothetical protein